MEAIDLGKKYDMKKEAVVSTDSPNKSKIDYPTLYINHGDESSALNDMPDEGEAVITYKVKRYSEDLENDTCSCELSVTSIKPLGKKAKKTKTSEENLDSALDDVVKKKTKKETY